MGLLGSNWDDPRSASNMALAAGLLRGDFGGGLLGSQQAFNEAKQSAFKQQVGQMQMQEMQSQIDARKLTAQQAARKQALIDGLLNGGGAPAAPAQPGQLGSGSFGILPTAPGVSPIPQPAAGGARVPSLSFDQLAALKMYGVDLTDIHKYANEPRKMESGSTYVDRVTGQERYMPKLPEGMTINGGRAGFVSGFADSVASLEGAKARATEGVKAALDPVQVASPDGSMRFVPRSQVVAPQPMRAQPADGDRYAILTQELAKARQTGNAADVAAIEAEISRLPASVRAGGSPSGLAIGGGFQATPTTAQAVDRIKAEGTARADVERDTGKQKDAKLYGQMRSGIDRAIDLLKQGPTASGIGAGVDFAANLFGMSTKGADVASQLDTLSGWLTANTPRMEGPQSNVDVQNYRIMAGMVGDRTKPISQRLAAAEEVRKLQDKYAELNGYKKEGGATGDFGGKTMLDSLPKTAPKGTRVRDTETGKILQFNGMSWVEAK